MAWQQHEPDMRLRLFSARWTFLVGVLVGVLVTGAVWAVTGTVATGHRAHRAPATVTRLEGPGHGNASGRDAGPPASRGRCATDYLLQRRPLAAAAGSLAQWRLHVEAMNQLVSGEISWAQATAFWNHSRTGAQRLLRTYDEAHAAYRDRSRPCPRRQKHAGRPHVRACAHAVHARDRELRVAAVALRSWRHHVRTMDMVHGDRISPTTVTSRWVRHWRIAARQLRHYRAAARAADGLHC